MAKEKDTNAAPAAQDPAQASPSPPSTDSASSGAEQAAADLHPVAADQSAPGEKPPALAGIELAPALKPDVSATSESATTEPGVAENVPVAVVEEPAPTVLSWLENVEHRTVGELFGNIGAIVADVEDVGKSATAHALEAAKNGEHALAGILERIASLAGDFRTSLKNIEHSVPESLQQSLRKAL
jgi:hypothetical protein